MLRSPLCIKFEESSPRFPMTGLDEVTQDHLTLVRNSIQFQSLLVV